MADSDEEDEYSGSDGGDNVDKRRGNTSTDKVYDVDLAKKRLDEARARYLRLFNPAGEARPDGPLIRGVQTYTGHNVAGRNQNEVEKKQGYSDHTIYRIRSLLQRAMISRFRAWKALQAKRGVNNRPFKPYEHPGAADERRRPNKQQSHYEEAARSFLANAKMQMPVLSHHKQPGGDLSFNATLHLPRQRRRLTGPEHIEKADNKALTGTGLKKRQVASASKEDLIAHLKAASAVYLPEEKIDILKARVIRHIEQRDKRREAAAAAAREAEEDDEGQGEEEEEAEDEEEEKASSPPKRPRVDDEKEKKNAERKELDDYVLKRDKLAEKVKRLFHEIGNKKFFLAALFQNYIRERHNRGEIASRYHELLLNNHIDDTVFEIEAYNRMRSIKIHGDENDEEFDGGIDPDEAIYAGTEFPEMFGFFDLGTLQFMYEAEKRIRTKQIDAEKEKKREREERKLKLEQRRLELIALQKKAAELEATRKAEEYKAFRKRKQLEFDQGKREEKAVKVAEETAVKKAVEDQKAQEKITKAEHAKHIAEGRENRAKFLAAVAEGKRLRRLAKKTSFQQKANEAIQARAQQAAQQQAALALQAQRARVLALHLAPLTDEDERRNRGEGKPSSFFIAKLLAETARSNTIKGKKPIYQHITDVNDPNPHQQYGPNAYLSDAFINKIADFKRRQGLYKVRGDPRFPVSMGTQFEVDSLYDTKEKKRKLKETNASGAKWMQRLSGTGLSNYGLMTVRNSDGEGSNSDSSGDEQPAKRVRVGASK
jgi:hypothetical protein